MAGLLAAAISYLNPCYRIIGILNRMRRGAEHTGYLRRPTDPAPVQRSNIKRRMRKRP